MKLKGSRSNHQAHNVQDSTKMSRCTMLYFHEAYNFRPLLPIDTPLEERMPKSRNPLVDAELPLHCSGSGNLPEAAIFGSFLDAT
eukprot:3602881-Rhodomonas_salina.1